MLASHVVQVLASAGQTLAHGLHNVLHVMKTPFISIEASALNPGILRLWGVVPRIFKRVVCGTPGRAADAGLADHEVHVLAHDRQHVQNILHIGFLLSFQLRHQPCLRAYGNRGDGSAPRFRG